MKLVLATNNPEKAFEMQTLLSKSKIEIINAKEAGISLDDVIENGKTFAENAKIKAFAAMKKSGLPALADDSGLVVDALDGEPGIYSARYAGNGASDRQKVEKLLARLNEVNAADRKAHFICAICLIFPDGREICTQGECYGEIGFSPKGENGFGYDSIFISENGKTFAELSREEKDEISHRGKALKNFLKLLCDFK